MAYVATMGTSSCATIAIGGFKGQKAFDINEEYKKSGTFENNTDRSELSVQSFYSKVLHPLAQDLGRSMELPFRGLMGCIDESRMQDKFIIATLNEYQNEYKDNYWVKELEHFGFQLIDKTKNNIGMMCYVYIRNQARPDGFKIGVQK